MAVFDRTVSLDSGSSTRINLDLLDALFNAPLGALLKILLGDFSSTLLGLLLSTLLGDRFKGFSFIYKWIEDLLGIFFSI